LKLMSVVALVIAPSIAINADKMTAYNEDKVATELVAQQEQQVSVEIEATEEGDYIAMVTSTTEVGGEVIETTKEFTANSKEAIKSKVEAYNTSIAIE